MDRNERQPGQPQRPTEWGVVNGTDQPATAPGDQPSFWQANPGGREGLPPQPGQAPYPAQGQSYPPEHAPFARPGSGQPNVDPRGASPGYPPPGNYPPPGPNGYSPNGQPPYPQNPAWQVQYPPGQYPPGYGPGYQAPGGRAPGPGFGFSAGPPVAPTMARRKKGSIIPALIFGLLALILGVVAVYLYVQERNPENPVAPTALPAQNQFVQVQTALQDAGLTATIERQNATSPSIFPTPEPGQAISINDNAAWIYIFPSVDAQEAATASLDNDDLGPVTNNRATPLTTGPPMLFSNSNVVILLSMDDNPSDDIQAKIKEAVDSLP